jgi:tetratricopeptide (TPR) repeat protein
MIMKLKLPAILLTAALGIDAAGQQSEFAIGRAYYSEGEFKKAAAHFQMAIRTSPDGTEAYYWIGMSYEMLADIAAPFGGKYNAMARFNLTKAAELAPNRLDYRRELFDFLVDSGGSSRAAWRQAGNILRTVSESDPEYAGMRRRFEHARRESSSVEARLGRLFLAAPRAAYRIAELSHSTLSPRPEISSVGSIR